MRIVAIIQARMGSTRLPGKVLKRILDKPLLEFQVERLKRCQTIDQIVIATTTKAMDDIIIEFCKVLDIAYYRGAEGDVLSRYYEAASYYQADVIVRLTSDCPLIEPYVVDRVVNGYLDNPNYDYVSNTIERTYPRGLDVSLVTYSSLEEIHHKAKAELDREHVTRYLYNRPNEYKLLNIFNDKNESCHRWTVDTKEDFNLVKKIIETLYPNKPAFQMEDILHVLNSHPDWIKINDHVEQKKT
ncbi:cytidylyltransferase domain-containing protein [Gracilibacillus phocaeensis]|uniref:cytidylyltransferase domain-containing protein n=1 Tax=Gracilibacillus phocaeensis TaxID=2042304 RepID=UPI001031743C|nr:glycosyltransferase family protein [Gracilibacillus phocaeensis]